MGFQLQPLFNLSADGQSGKPQKITFACELPVFEPGYNFDEAGNSTLSASNDWQAVLEFLNQYDSPHTIRSYSSEIEKFLLWLLVVKNMPLSGLKREDWQSYLIYLANVPPEHSGARCKRFLADNQYNPSWRPFFSSDGRLSDKSIAKSSKIIEAMFSFLVNAGFLKASPVITARRRKISNDERSIEISERFLPQELLDLSIDILHGTTSSVDASVAANYSYLKKLKRSLYVIQLLRELGLRASEMVNAKMSDFIIKDHSWTLKVVGKGSKKRRVQVPDRLRDTIMDYRLSLGLPPYPLIGEETPLIGSLNNGKSITTRRLGQLIDEAFSLVARHLEAFALSLDPTSHEYGSLIRNCSLLSAASPHWLRHSHATEFLKESNQDLVATMRRLGHSNLNVAMIYQHIDDDALF